MQSPTLTAYQAAERDISVREARTGIRVHATRPTSRWRLKARERTASAWTGPQADAHAASFALQVMTDRSVPGSVSHRILERSDESPWPFSLHHADVST
ncbi:hypothetical protein [Demequina sp.]|uniref:hypothetical protein n=1 Tax=Demequina sp. TaxID=2050685 RepID=UPI0025C25EF3|nr:hypothetical protein [Demequina sp.]